jgi:hypothetical protein
MDAQARAQRALGAARRVIAAREPG